MVATVMKLFNIFLTLEKNGVKGAIRFLLKSIEKKPLITQDKELLKAYLLTILANNERSLTKACSLLVNFKNIISFSGDDISFLRQMLNTHICSGHDLEAVWLTYLLIETNELVEEDLMQIIESNNELAQTLLLRRSDITPTQLDRLASKANSWFLLYELYANDIIDENTFVAKLNLNHNLRMYQKMKERKEHFCKK